MSHIDLYRGVSQVFSPAPNLFIRSCVCPAVQGANAFEFFALTHTIVPLVLCRWWGQWKEIFPKFAKASCNVSTSRIEGFDELCCQTN